MKYPNLYRLFRRKSQKEKSSVSDKAQYSHSTSTDWISGAYRSLDNLWRIRDTHDSRMGITFITYLRSKEIAGTAFSQLSFANVFDDSSVAMPDGIKAIAEVVTDRNNIVMLILTGRFSKQQAREAIHVFGGHVDREANKKYLAESAASFADALQRKGGGTVVWTDWPTEPSH